MGIRKRLGQWTVRPREWAKRQWNAQKRWLALTLLALTYISITWVFVVVRPGEEIDRLSGGLSTQERLLLHADTRRTFLQALAGFAAVVAVYFTYRRLSISEATLDATRDGQITERFTRAISQLGDAQAAVRIGGIYALERIARDSEKDHWTIMEVLMALLRYPPQHGKIAVGQPETQVILTVLGRRNVTKLNELGRHLDLRGADLKFRLLDGNFNGADLRHADLRSANLSGCFLERALFDGAGLEHIEGTIGKLYAVSLTFARLRKASLKYANLKKADFGGADLTGAHLWYAELDGARSLTLDQIESAHCYRRENLPEYLQSAVAESKSCDELVDLSTNEA